jgi:DNA-binding NarL/FixJ family response regulator
MTIRVILGEDSYLASEGIAHVLERADDIELVATHTDLKTLSVAIAEEHPDVVLTDIRMPPDNSDEGIRLANALRLSDPDIGVVVLSQHAEPAYATALLEGGSEGRAYLLKERVKNAGELARALHEVAEGGSVIDPTIVESLLRSRQRQEDAHLDQLTPRELEILGLIAEGRSNASIADALVLSKRAVERHINGIFMKLELGNAEDVSRRVRAALLYLAEQAG